MYKFPYKKTTANKVIITPYEKEKTGVGLYLPEMAKNINKIQKGKVLLAGSNITYLKPGDIIFFQKFCIKKTGIYFEGKECFYIDDYRYILAKIVLEEKC